MCSGIIYKATNKINGKVYIGKTIQSLKKRRKEHESNSLNKKINNYFCNALRKYGWNNFKWKIIDSIDNEKELNILEIFYIADYRKKGKLYNMTDGGEGVSGLIPSKETRKKISEAKKGNQNRLGKITSDETKRKISEANKGKKLSEEHKRKLSEAKKGKKFSIEHKRKLSETHKGHKHTEEIRMKISESQKGKKYCLGHKASNETRKKMSVAQKIRRKCEVAA